MYEVRLIGDGGTETVLATFSGLCETVECVNQWIRSRPKEYYGVRVLLNSVHQESFWWN